MDLVYAILWKMWIAHGKKTLFELNNVYGFEIIQMIG